MGLLYLLQSKVELGSQYTLHALRLSVATGCPVSVPIMIRPSISDLVITCLTSGMRRGVNEVIALLGCYTSWIAG